MCIIAGGHYGLLRVRNSCRRFLAFLVLGKMLKIFFSAPMVAFYAGFLILLVQKSFIRLSPSTSTFLVVVVVVLL